MTIRELFVGMGYEIDKSSEKKAESSIKSLKSFAGKMLGTIAIGFSLSKMNNLAEEFNGINDSINYATKGLGDQEEIQQKILKASNGTKSSYGDTAKVVKNLVQENKDLFPVDDAIAFHNATTMLFKTAGKGNEEIVSLQDAINRSFAKGTVEAQTMNQLFRQSPEAIQLLSNHLEVSSDKLMQMATDGKIAVEDLKNAFIGSADQISKDFDNLDYSISDAVLNIRNQWGLFCDSLWVGGGITNGVGKMMVRAFTGFMDVVKKLQPLLERVIKAMLTGVQKAMDLISRVGSFLEQLINKIGGIEQAVKLVAIVAGAIWLALNAGKILSFLKGLGTALSGINLKIMLIVGIIILLALIIDDFINFMKGNDSVIGALFEKAGIDADKARETIFNVWNRIKDFLLDVWDFLNQAVGIYFDAIKDFFDRHGESIKQNFERAWNIVKDFLSGVWTFLSDLAAVIFGNTEDDINGSNEGIKETLLSVWQSIVDMLSAYWDVIYEMASAVFNAIATVIEFIFSAIKAFWDSWGTNILSWFKTIWDNLGKIIDGFLGVIKGLADFIASVFKGDWEGAWNAIKDIFINLWDIIVAYIEMVWETITLIFEIALSAIKTVWETIWNAIKDFFTNILDGIAQFASDIWENIRSSIEEKINNILAAIIIIFTEIKEFISNTITGIKENALSIFENIATGISNIVGKIKESIVSGFESAIEFIKSLPSQAIEWGKDIIEGLVSGITGSIGKIRDAVSGVADNIKSFLHFSVPDEGPLTDYETWMPDFMQGLGEGIAENKGIVIDKVKDLADSMAMLTQAGTAKAQTVNNSSFKNSVSNVTQNNTFNNSYTGGDTQLQANASKAMSKSTDDATTLAKGLVYVR